MICIYKLYVGYVSKENSISLLLFLPNETVHSNLQIFSDSPFFKQEKEKKLFYKRMI